MTGKPTPPGEDMRIGFRKEPTSPPPSKLVKINDKYYSVAIYRVDMFGKRELISDKPELKEQVEALEKIAQENLTNFSKYSSIKLNLETGKVHYQESGHYFPATVEQDLTLSLKALGASISAKVPYSATSTSLPSATPPEEKKEEEAAKPSDNTVPASFPLRNYMQLHEEENQAMDQLSDLHKDVLNIHYTHADGNCLFDAMGIGLAMHLDELDMAGRENVIAVIRDNIGKFKKGKEDFNKFDELLKDLANDKMRFKDLMLKHRQNLQDFMRLLAWTKETNDYTAGANRVLIEAQRDDKDVDQYLQDLKISGHWGCEVEIQALQNALNVPIGYVGYRIENKKMTTFAPTDNFNEPHSIKLLQAHNHFLALTLPTDPE